MSLVAQEHDETDGSHAPRLGLLLSVMCVALALVIGATSSLSLALPNLALDTGATQTELTWVVNAYALVFAGLLLPIGFAADRFGRRPFLVYGLLLFGLASLGSALVTDPSIIIALRGVAGVGAAAVMPATLSVLVDAYPEEKRPLAISVWAGVSGAGAMIGIVAAGLLLEGFGWSSIQILYGVAAAIGALACHVTVPHSRNPELRQDVAGGALSALGLFLLVYGIIEGPERGWADPLTWGGLTAGAALLVAFVVVELRSDRPMLDVRLFRHPGVAAGSLLVALQFFAAFGFFFLAPQWLQYVEGQTPLQSALWLLPMAVGIGPASRFGPHILERWGARAMSTVGMLLMAGCYAAFATLADASVSLWFFAASLVVFGFGFGLAITPGTSLIIEGLPEDRRTLSAAVNDVTREVGGALGSAVAASILLAVYSDRLAPATEPLPASSAEAAEEGLTQALGVADQLGIRGAELAESALGSFADGYSAALWMACVALVCGAVVCFRLAPSQETSAKDCPAD